MAENKKDEQNRETKAGLMDKHSGGKASEETVEKSEETTENTPKIGKNEAGDRKGEPLH